MDMMKQFAQRMHDIRTRINNNEIERDRDNSGLEKMIEKYYDKTQALRLKLNAYNSIPLERPVQQVVKPQQKDDEMDALRKKLMPAKKDLFKSPNKPKWPKKIVGDYKPRRTQLVY